MRSKKAKSSSTYTYPDVNGRISPTAPLTSLMNCHLCHELLPTDDHLYVRFSCCGVATHEDCNNIHNKQHKKSDPYSLPYSSPLPPSSPPPTTRFHYVPPPQRPSSKPRPPSHPPAGLGEDDCPHCFRRYALFGSKESIQRLCTWVNKGEAWVRDGKEPIPITPC